MLTNKMTMVDSFCRVTFRGSLHKTTAIVPVKRSASQERRSQTIWATCSPERTKKTRGRPKDTIRCRDPQSFG